MTQAGCTSDPRREAVRIALRLCLQRDTVDLIEAAANFAQAASELVADHAEMFMTEQTYLQHAQPSTFGRYLLSFTSAVQREIDRLVEHGMDQP